MKNHGEKIFCCVMLWYGLFSYKLSAFYISLFKHNHLSRWFIEKSFKNFFQLLSMDWELLELNNFQRKYIVVTLTNWIFSIAPFCVMWSFKTGVLPTIYFSFLIFLCKLNTQRHYHRISLMQWSIQKYFYSLKCMTTNCRSWSIYWLFTKCFILFFIRFSDANIYWGKNKNLILIRKLIFQVGFHFYEIYFIFIIFFLRKSCKNILHESIH